MDIYHEERLLTVKQSLYIPPETYSEEIFNSLFADKHAEKDMVEESGILSNSAKTTTNKIQTKLDKLILSSNQKLKPSLEKENPEYFPVKREIILSESNGLENIIAAIGDSIKAEPEKWRKESALSQETPKPSSKSKKVKVSTHKRIFSNVKVKNNTNLFTKSSQSSQNSEYSTPQRLPLAHIQKDLM